jgi:hypothetical protein
MPLPPNQGPKIRPLKAGRYVALRLLYGYNGADTRGSHNVHKKPPRQLARRQPWGYPDNGFPGAKAQESPVAHIKNGDICLLRAEAELLQARRRRLFGRAAADLDTSHAPPAAFFGAGRMIKYRSPTLKRLEATQ